MSVWHEITDKDDIDLSIDGTVIDVLYKSDDTGNYYIEIPVEFIEDLICQKKPQEK